MCNDPRRLRFLVSIVATVVVLVGSSNQLVAQTASTGALTGVTVDSSEALVSGATLNLVNRDKHDTESRISDEGGRFDFPFLKPGTYDLCVSKTGFSQLCMTGINVLVTETHRLELRLADRNR